jgi:hypothetical protein
MTCRRKAVIAPIFALSVLWGRRRRGIPGRRQDIKILSFEGSRQRCSLAPLSAAWGRDSLIKSATTFLPHPYSNCVGVLKWSDYVRRPNRYRRILSCRMYRICGLLNARLL